MLSEHRLFIDIRQAFENLRRCWIGIEQRSEREIMEAKRASDFRSVLRSVIAKIWLRQFRSTWRGQLFFGLAKVPKHASVNLIVNSIVVSARVQGRRGPESSEARDGEPSPCPLGLAKRLGSESHQRSVAQESKRARGCEASPLHPKAAGGSNFRQHLRCPGLDSQRTRSGQATTPQQSSL